MINIKEHIKNCQLIKLKHELPQVGSEIIHYNNIMDLIENKLYDFIIDKNGNLLIGTGHYKLNKKMHELYYAGKLMRINDKITYIDNDSGHYEPTYSNLITFKNILEKNDNFSNNLNIKYYNFNENIYNLLSFDINSKLYLKVLKRAQFEAEVELGVNPTNENQADVSALSEKDYDYINKVCKIVDKKINNIDWLKSTIININNMFKNNSKTTGIKYNDELYKGGRGILEEYLQKKYKNE